MTCFVLRSIFTVRSPPSTRWPGSGTTSKYAVQALSDTENVTFILSSSYLNSPCLIQGNLKCFHEIALSCWPLKNCAHGSLSEIPRDAMFIENHPVQVKAPEMR